MKYYGKIVHNKDLITKEYADDRLYMKVDKLDYDPDQKTEAMTHSVGKDNSGKLWAQPGVVPRGAWTSSESYVKGDIVSYLGGSYIAIQNNTNIVPANTSYWMNLASGTDANSVHYTTDSGKTDAEKAIARANIGASKKANYRLINQITITETASNLIIDKDTSGNSFRLGEFILTTYADASEGNTSGVYLKLKKEGTSKHYGTMTLASTSSAQYNYIKVTCNGIVDPSVYKVYAGVPVAYSSPNLTQPTGNSTIVNFSYITGIIFEVTGSPLYAGLNITLIGVDYED